MFEFLNQGWVGSIIGLLGLVVGAIGLFLYYKSKIGSRPICQMRGLRLIGKEEQELPSEMKILYANSEVPRLTLTRIWFWNAGTETIEGSQVVQDDPIRFTFEKDDVILTANVAAHTRTINKCQISIPPERSNEAIVAFDFFDANDGVRIDLLHTSRNRYPIILGTIRGIPSGIKQLTTTSTSRFDVKFMRILNQRTMMYGIALVLGVITLIAGLLPDAWLTAIGDALLYSKNSTSSHISTRIAFLIVGSLYTLMPLIALLSRRKRYPPALDDTDQEAKPVK
jgi:hypothetical protein